jgi:hypothetical protein
LLDTNCWNKVTVAPDIVEPTGAPLAVTTSFKYVYASVVPEGCVGVGVGVDVPVGVGVAGPVLVGVIDGVFVGVILGVLLGVVDGVLVGVMLGVTLIVGVTDGVGEGVGCGPSVGGTFTPTIDCHTGISFSPYGFNASSKSKGFFFV